MLACTEPVTTRQSPYAYVPVKNGVSTQSTSCTHSSGLSPSLEDEVEISRFLQRDLLGMTVLLRRGGIGLSPFIRLATYCQFQATFISIIKQRLFHMNAIYIGTLRLSSFIFMILILTTTLNEFVLLYLLIL
jgi:hypothetical protein